MRGKTNILQTFTPMMISPDRATSRQFPRAFWTANIVELFERAAYYGMFIALTLYLTNVVGFSDINAAWIGGIFAGGLYLLPPFSGALADTIGFRRSLLLAFFLLTVGYFTLGAFPYKITVLPALLVTMIGGSFIKSIITGTVAKTSDEDNRARAYSIFYAMVNIGAFAGKGLAYPLRLYLGLEAINLYAAALTLLALAAVALFFKQVDTTEHKKSLSEVWAGFRDVVTNVRLLTLILIVMGFAVSGYLLNAYCPDPRMLSAEQLVHAYDNAHYIWYYFAGIGAAATVALVTYGRVTSK